MDMFSKTNSFSKKHHRCISLESGQTLTKKSYPKMPTDLPRFFPRRYSTPELVMRKHALKHQRVNNNNGQPISNKSCQTDILGLDKYLQRSPPEDASSNSTSYSTTALKTYKKQLKKPKVRSVAVHCERRRLTFAAFKGCQKFKHVYKRKISLPPSSSVTITPANDERRRDSSTLPKLRPDRMMEMDKPVTVKTGSAIKLPKITTKDVKSEPDPPNDGGGTKLVKLSRPLSTDSGNGRCDDKKLAHFRASSAPKINSRYVSPIVESQSPEREQSTPDSSDTADTTLDMSFVRQELDNTATATAATNTTSSTTRTVSTSTTFTEPSFPIVFSCESVLRHPMDGGYVSHTESHRFSVHYVPTTDSSRTATETDDGSQSPLIFTSGEACQNERCLTGDTVSVMLSGKPDDSTVSQYVPSTSTSNTVGERHLIVEHSNTDAQYKIVPCNAAVSDETTIDNDRSVFGEKFVDFCSLADEGCDPAQTEKYDGKKNVRMEGLYVLGKGDAIKQYANAFEEASPPMSANNVIDIFGEDGKEGAELESHAHTDGMQLQSERNYERLTQNYQIDSDRTVSHQSPKLNDVTTTRFRVVEQRNDLNADGNQNGLSELDILSLTNVEPTKELINVLIDKHDETTQDQIDYNCYCSTETTNQSDENTDMASRCRQHHCDLTENRRTERNITRIGENINRSTNYSKKHCGLLEKQHFERNFNKQNVPNQLHDSISKKRDANHNTEESTDRKCLSANAHSNIIDYESINRRVKNDSKCFLHDSHFGRTHFTNKTTPQNLQNNQHCGLVNKQSTDIINKRVDQTDTNNLDFHKCDNDQYGMDLHYDINLHRRAENDMSTCRKCSNYLSNKRNEMKNGLDDCYNIKTSQLEHHNCRNLYDNNERSQCPVSKRRLEAVNEVMESNYIGGFLFGDAFYKKQPQKYEMDECNNEYPCKYEYYDDSKTANFASKHDNTYDYYQNYVPKTRYSPRNEDCTVFADVPRNLDNRECVQPENKYSTTAVQTSYYSQLDKTLYANDKNTDSDDSLTDSLENFKYEGAVSYFLSLNGQKSAVTFTLKMPNTLQSRLNLRQSRLKKHLHVSTTVKKTSMRVRTRHKGCQTLWTEEKGVQVQRGSTANATRKPVVDDHKVLETLLASLERNRVSENQIRVVGGLKMVSEGNQTEKLVEPPFNRQTQTQTTRDVAAGPGTPEKNSKVTAAGTRNKSQLHTTKKVSSDNALMVGIVRQNKYKGREALDVAKNDQLLTLSKGWINFYTLRSDGADTETQELHNNDDEIKHEDESQQYTVHVQAVPEPLSLPVVHIPHRSNLHLPKMCSAAKHLPKLVQTETNNHHSPLHLAPENCWSVSVNGPNNMHMKVSLLPNKSDIKTSESFDLNEENKLESRRLAVQRKNNYIRKPYRNVKRTQSTPRDMFSDDVSRTESALSAESKYIETIDTQLLIHKARRRLSQEWDTRIQNEGVTESVQLVVTGDSVSSKTSQHYATKGHQHCSFKRQSRRI